MLSSHGRPGKAYNVNMLDHTKGRPALACGPRDRANLKRGISLFNEGMSHWHRTDSTLVHRTYLFGDTHVSTETWNPASIFTEISYSSIV